MEVKSKELAHSQRMFILYINASSAAIYRMATLKNNNNIDYIVFVMITTIYSTLILYNFKMDYDMAFLQPAPNPHTSFILGQTSSSCLHHILESTTPAWFCRILCCAFTKRSNSLTSGIWHV